MSNDALVGRETANLLGGNVADDPHNFRVTVIDSVADHVRKQGLVAIFGSEKGVFLTGFG